MPEIDTLENTEIEVGEMTMAFHALYTKFVNRMATTVFLTAKKMAERGDPIEKFLEYCVRQAAGNSATWNGGTYSASNVIESIRAHAWITGAIDLRIRDLFTDTAR